LEQLVSCETVASQYGRKQEAEENTALEAVTRRQLMKMKQIENNYCVL
jgi:hypothetical protein